LDKTQEAGGKIQLADLWAPIAAHTVIDRVRPVACDAIEQWLASRGRD